MKLIYIDEPTTLDGVSSKVVKDSNLTEKLELLLPHEIEISSYPVKDPSNQGPEAFIYLFIYFENGSNLGL